MAVIEKQIIVQKLGMIESLSKPMDFKTREERIILNLYIDGYRFSGVTKLRLI